MKQLTFALLWGFALPLFGVPCLLRFGLLNLWTLFAWILVFSLVMQPKAKYEHA
jgi:hypothetical protein